MAMQQNSVENNIHKIKQFFSDFDTMNEDLDGQNEIEDIENKISILLGKRRQFYDHLNEKQKRNYQLKLEQEIQQEEKLKKES